MREGSLWFDGRVWAARVAVAVSMGARLRGLLGRRSLPAGEGLLIMRCGSIHTVGMRFAIDVVFLDRAWQVCRVHRDVRPGRLMVWGGWRADRALETAASGLNLAGIVPGARVEWRGE